ncbi:MAG: sensor domain-containing diguanylate cyclase [Proteobacteria bacterium]|nr:sensor domain-containing diguanylate cyclase [Pseudomonadota bacterium]MBU1710009.1 sensor domain-containing diguanylate cyclase [Pseudomonadota bacterium]
MKYDYADMIENIHEGIYFVDKDRRITYWNKAAEKITGFKAVDVIGSRCMDNILVHVDYQGKSLCKSGCPMEAAIEQGVPLEMEVFLHHKKGHRVPVLVSVAPLKDETGMIVGGAQMFSDISSTKIMEEKIRELEKLTLLDPLTRLSNRLHLEYELQAILEELKRYDLSFGILFMDIDHFKDINDTYGHVVGDLVLKTVSNTIRSAARPFDVFGRWNGDEFVGIFRNVDETGLREAGERYRFLVENTLISAGGRLLRATVSMGATLASTDDTMKSLVQRVEELMRQSKEAGRNRLTSG